MTALLDVADLHKSYGAMKVLKGLDFDVRERETFAIIGPNGAGKTTLFKVLTGEARQDSGKIRFRGRDITAEPAFRRVHSGFGRTFQVARVFPELTVEENVVVVIEARLRAEGKRIGRWYDLRPAAAVRDEAHALLADLGLAQSSTIKAKFLSHGDKKRLEFAVMLGGRPSILMLDEPTAGMSPSERVAITQLIRKIKTEREVTVLMTEHDMGVIFGLSDRLMVMNYGQIIAIGTPEEVRANKTVRDVYLGQEMYHA
ncbi:ABC transporter ATP-binding protein [Aminobacter sp. LjRoot7]|uniref:ABC transporter ATP-binding protein n=1 Tax=Aminobacter sp. LjRoot7 TaxID=3342335 RepID=UPI003ECFE5C7